MKKTNKKYFWYGLIAVCLGALNAPVIKHASSSINPVTINFLRFSVSALVTFPFFLYFFKKLTPKNITYSLLSGFTLFFATMGFVNGVNLSTASYVALLLLLSPVTLVFFSIKMTNDKVDRKRFAGFSLAILGAILVVAGPIFLAGNTSIDFYPKATLFIGLTVITYPLAVIFAKKANESRKKLPITSIIFIQTSVIAILSLATGLLTNKIDFTSVSESEISVLTAIAYSGIMVGVLDRSLNVISYEHVGSAVNGGLVYLGLFITLLVSVLVLDESLSLVALVGGVIILLGVAMTEHGLPKIHRFNYHHRHH